MDVHDPLHPEFDDIERRLLMLKREHRMRRLRCLRDEAPESRLTKSSIILVVDVDIRSAIYAASNSAISRELLALQSQF